MRCYRVCFCDYECKVPGMHAFDSDYTPSSFIVHLELFNVVYELVQVM